jgi:hypothetical protein
MIRNELLRLRVRQRAQERGIHHAEDGCVGADPQGQAQQRHHGEARALAHPAQREADILTQISQPAHLKHIFLQTPSTRRV